MERANLVILMAGGLGTRLRPLTDTIPKPLIKVRGKPVIEHIVESFLAHGFRRFVLSVGYRGEMIRSHFGDGERWGASIGYVWDTVRMGTAGALGVEPKAGASLLVRRDAVIGNKALK
jgi:NDP-sugar pyrophosphorylase family protein